MNLGLSYLQEILATEPRRVLQIPFEQSYAASVKGFKRVLFGVAEDAAWHQHERSTSIAKTSKTTNDGRLPDTNP